MTKKALEKKLKNACQSLGVYKPEFDMIISELADLQIRKELVKESFEESGEPYIVTFANGNTGTNSHIKLYMEMNAQTIKYCNELGLTPAGLKKLGEVDVKQGGLMEALAALG